MGKYSVPDEIRKYKPKGTMVKNISGYYYVYEYTNFTDNNGKRHTKMGKTIGSIKEGVGFVPNSTFSCNDEISSLDFGEYAITLANSKKTFELLNECFNPQDAAVIYSVAMIHFINGFTYLKDIHYYYDMSVLSLRFPTIKLGYDALTKLYDSLGRRQGNVLKLEEKLIAECTHETAIDGHVIGSESDNNDLAEKGYKFSKLGETQVNLLMAYDVNTGIPLLSKIYEGASVDKVSIKDFINQVEMKNMLFIVDAGFYSTDNINILSSNGNEYIIPLSKNLNACKSAVSSLEMHDRFIYQKGKKGSAIEYKDDIINGYRVITYRDLSESALKSENYKRHLICGDKGYTEEGYREAKYFLGVIVLQTSLENKNAQEIYELYKKRWTIETFFNYFKNKVGYNDLHDGDYYQTQGLSFIMLVAALIHQEMEKAVSDINGKNISTVLLEARMLKVQKRHGQWTVCNCLKKQAELFEQLNTPLSLPD